MKIHFDKIISVVNFYHFEESNRNKMVEKFASSSLVFTLGLRPHSKLPIGVANQKQETEHGFPLLPAIHAVDESKLCDGKNDTMGSSETRQNRTPLGKTTKERCFWKNFAVILDRIFFIGHLIVMTAVSVYYYIQIKH